jgi:hypothetical protein
MQIQRLFFPIIQGEIMIVKMFDDCDSAQDILNAIVLNGVAGVSGGRVAVRKKLGEVSKLAEKGKYQSIIANVSIDHPDTELGYPYDNAKLDLNEARDEVRKAYDAGNADTL